VTNKASLSFIDKRNIEATHVPAYVKFRQLLTQRNNLKPM